MIEAMQVLGALAVLALMFFPKAAIAVGAIVGLFFGGIGGAVVGGLVGALMSCWDYVLFKSEQ